MKIHALSPARAACAATAFARLPVEAQPMVSSPKAAAALIAAAAAAERPGGERWRSDGMRQLEPQQKNPGNNCRGRSLFSTLFNVAAIRGKAPRVVDYRLAA